jgi:hypothetical protein
MSHRAIAAALALGDISAGERAGRVLTGELRQPAAPLLARRGLLEVDSAAGGRGNSPLVRLRFAEHRHHASGEVNAELFETVLSYSRCRVRHVCCWPFWRPWRTARGWWRGSRATSCVRRQGS